MSLLICNFYNCFTFFRGMRSADADKAFLECIRGHDMYGVHTYQCHLKVSYSHGKNRSILYKWINSVKWERAGERERERGRERERRRERIAYKLYIILYTERLATMMIYMFIFDKCGVIGFRVWRSVYVTLVYWPWSMTRECKSSPGPWCSALVTVVKHSL